MRVYTNQTDSGGSLLSQPFQLQGRGPVTVTRRVYLHYGNTYAIPEFEVKVGDFTMFRIKYANMTWDTPPQKACSGIYVCRNDGNPHDRNHLQDVSDPVSVVWDTWYNEKVTYEPDTGRLRYFINDALQIDYNTGVLPQTAGTTVQIKVDAWGWYTGHQHFFDDLTVAQALGVGTPTPTSTPTPTPAPTASVTPREPLPTPPMNVPRKPGNVHAGTVVPVGNKVRVSLVFTPGEASMQGYIVQARSLDALRGWSSWKIIRRLPAGGEDVASYVAALRLKPALKYQFLITAINAAGKSKSKVITVKAPPAVLQSNGAAAASHSRLKLPIIRTGLMQRLIAEASNSHNR
jgi:hypothetical protein